MKIQEKSSVAACALGVSLQLHAPDKYHLVFWEINQVSSAWQDDVEF